MGERIARAVAVLWIAAMLGGLAIGASGSGAAKGALLDHGPGCLFRTVTGVKCPFCGMTHATVALGAGDLDDAQRYHPLAIVVLLGTFVAAGLVAAGRTALLMRGRRPLLVLGAVAAVWILRLLL